MNNITIPDRNKWSFWVALSWIIALVSIISGAILIYHFGTTRLYVSTTSTNIEIWAIGISQAVAGLMIAGIFSMVDSIYKNSCDQLSITLNEKNEAESTSKTSNKKAEIGFRLNKIPESNKLREHLNAGDMIVTVNGQRVSKIENILCFIKSGENIFLYITPSGQRKTLKIPLSDFDFQGIKGESGVIPGGHKLD